MDEAAELRRQADEGLTRRIETLGLASGQTIDDFIAAAPAMAPVMNAKELRMTLLAQRWVQVVLVTAPLVAVPDRSAQDAEVLPTGV